MRTVERIASDDEDGFASMKRFVDREIRGWVWRERQRGVKGKGRGGDGVKVPRLVVDVVIERMGGDQGGEEEGVGGLEGQGDVELEW